MVNINDVARHAGVSRSTVSYVLSGKRPISEVTRARVQRSIEALDFRADPRARAFTLRRTNIVAFAATIAPNALPIDAETQREFLMSAAVELRSHDLDVLLLARGAEQEMRRLSAEVLADGIIITDVQWRDPRIEQLRQARVPVVLLGLPEDSLGLSTIDFDFAAAGAVAARHLRSLGHRHIGVIAGGAVMSFDVRFQRGLHAAAARLALHTEVRGRLSSRDEAAAYVRELRAPGNQCTAVLVHEPSSLPPLMAALSDAGVQVPEDLSVVAVLHDAAARRLFVSVTTIDIPLGQMARTAVRAVTAQINGSPASHSLLPPQLVDRGTTSVPRAAST